MSEDRTEAASPRRLQKARDSGDVPLSREAVLLAGLAPALLVLMVQTRNGLPLAWFARALSRRDFSAGLCLKEAAWAVLPTAMAAIGGLAAGTLLQTGFLLRPAGLAPDVSRISPMRGLKRIGSVETLLATGRNLLKLGIFGWAVWTAMASIIPALPGMAFRPVMDLSAGMAEAAWRLIWPMAAAQGAIALADIALVRFRHARRQRMTKQEVRDEMKDAEGDPHIKQKIKTLARTRARRRMLAAAAKATVLVTNPTHYAVALTYQRGSRAAPRVVAKGVDEVAARLREVAMANNIPMVANPPLARALYRVEIDSEIPQEHFRAVAEIVAYVWRLNARQRAGVGY